MRKALLSCFNLKKSAESHRMLMEAMATMFYRKQRAEIGFAGSMTTILTWVTRSVKIGRLRTVNCRLVWTRTISNRKKCLPSNWVFLKQSFPCGYNEEGSKDRKMGAARVNWTIADAIATPKHMPNSACQTKKKVVLALDCDRRWKVDLFSESS